MSLFKIEIEETNRHYFWVEADTQAEARADVEDFLADDVKNNWIPYLDEDVYVVPAEKLPFGGQMDYPKPDENVWVGGPEGRWLTGKEWERTEPTPAPPSQKERLFTP